MEAYIGIDWSQSEGECFFGDSKQQKRLTIKPSPYEIQRLLREVQQLVPKALTIRVALEAGSSLWVRLLAEADVELHLIDPKQARRFAESLSPGGAKDDKRDAKSLFGMALSPLHRGNSYKPNSPQMRSLGRLAGMHERWGNACTAEVQRLRQLLADTMLPISRVFSKLTSENALAFLEKWPTPKGVCHLSKKSLESFCKRHRLKESTRSKLWLACQQCFELLEPVEDEVQALFVRQLVERIRLLQKSLQEIERKIKLLYDACEDSQTFASFKGIGPLLGSLLLADVFSKPSEQRDSAAVRTGASPLTNQSSKKKAKKGKKEEQKKRVRMRKSVPARLRRMTYLLGLQAIRNHDWARAQYDWKIGQGKNAACAFRVVVRSVLRILQALLRDGEEYSRDRYVRALKENMVPWATELPLEN